MDKREEIAKKYVPCRCDEAYTSRGLTAPDCPFHSTDPEMAMDEYMKERCLEFIQWMLDKGVFATRVVDGEALLYYRGGYITKEQLFENFL